MDSDYSTLSTGHSAADTGHPAADCSTSSSSNASNRTQHNPAKIRPTPVVDPSGKITFEALHGNVATLSPDGWLGSIGGSNAINVLRYSSNLSYAVQNILDRDLQTKSMLSNIINVMHNVESETTLTNNVLMQTNYTLNSTSGQLGETRALLSAVVNVVNEIIGVLNIVVVNFTELVGILTQKTIYPGQSYSDFKLAMLLPAFNVDSILFALQQFGGIQNVNESGNLPNYLLTSDLRMQLNWLNNILVPDYQKLVQQQQDYQQQQQQSSSTEPSEPPAA
jgi:hypothetical protein